MKKQKICIIGGSLTGLITAISLSKIDCDIDLIIAKDKKNLNCKGSIAVSDNNFEFIKKLNILKSLSKKSWPCSVMKLYANNKTNKISEIFQLDNTKKTKKILYMFENSKITKLMLNKIKKIKSIKIKNANKISEIKTSGLLKSIKINNKNFKYNLVIICSGSKSNLVKNIFNKNVIENSYKEISIVTTLKHDKCDNKVVRQFFIDDEILALLPISKSKTSIVWSVKNIIHRKEKKYLENKIKLYANKYLKNIKFENKFDHINLNFLIRSEYFKDRMLLFGDALHAVHPFVGQGFNMTLRDLSSLTKTLSNKIKLGLDIGSTNILLEFTKETKPRNFAYSIGINLLRDAFSSKNEVFKKIRNYFIKNLNQNNFAKETFYNIANKGLKF